MQDVKSGPRNVSCKKTDSFPGRVLLVSLGTTCSPYPYAGKNPFYAAGKKLWCLCTMSDDPYADP